MAYFCRLLSVAVALVLPMAVAGDGVGDALDQVLRSKISSIVTWQPRSAPLPLIVATYEQTPEDATGLPSRSLVIREALLGSSPVLRFSTGNSPVSLLPSKDHLISIWETASAFQVLVFAYENGAIRKTFEVGSDYEPEVLATDDDDGLAILVRKGKNESGSVEIWSANRGTFILTKSGPWANRYGLLLRE